MGARADYTLKQAVAMVNLNAEQWGKHLMQCGQCVETVMYSEPGYCERGWQLVNNCLKWKRRCKYAAKREGVVMTV